MKVNNEKYLKNTIIKKQWNNLSIKSNEKIWKENVLKLYFNLLLNYNMKIKKIFSQLLKIIDEIFFICPTQFECN